jgi:hypothetical protein
LFDHRALPPEQIEKIASKTQDLQQRIQKDLEWLEFTIKREKTVLKNLEKRTESFFNYFFSLQDFR